MIALTVNSLTLLGSSADFSEANGRPFLLPTARCLESGAKSRSDEGCEELCSNVLFGDPSGKR